MEPVRNDRLYIQPTLQHHRHFIPGFIHLASVNAFDRQHVEHNFIPVDGHWLGGNAEHCDSSPVTQVVDHVRSEEHTSELQSQSNLVCRLLLEKKKKKTASGLTPRPTVAQHPRHEHWPCLDALPCTGNPGR